MAGRPGPSNAMDKRGGEGGSSLGQNGVKLLFESFSKQAESKNSMIPLSGALPPPFVKQNGPLPFRETQSKDSFVGIPIGRGPPQNAFPVAPGPPQKIWILEQEMIRKAAAANTGGSAESIQRTVTPPLGLPPPFIRQASAPMPIRPKPFDPPSMSPSPQSSPQANLVWQHLFPNARIGTANPGGGMESSPSQGEMIKPADLSNMGLKQILGKVVDVTELEGVLCLNQPSIRPPPGFENFPTPPSLPDNPSWLLQKGGALPPISVAGSPQHGISLLSTWRAPALDPSQLEPSAPPHPMELGVLGGSMLPGASSPVVGAHREQQATGGFTLLNQDQPRGPSVKENFQGFWDNFTDPFGRVKNKKNKDFQENSVSEASSKLEHLVLKEKHEPKPVPEKFDEEKEKKKKKSKTKKRSKKTSESADNPETPATPRNDGVPSTPNGEKAPERKRPRRKSKGKKSRGDSGTFEDYLDIDSVMAGLQDKTLIKGEIRINAKNYKECYINNPDDKKDILISGTIDRNRALEGDIVVVELKTDEECVQTPSMQKMGRVVYILEKVHSRVCVGYLSKIREKDYATLCPRDSRIPRLLIPMTTVSMHIIQNPEAYESVLFKAKIVTWDTPNFAQGIIEEKLGLRGDVQVESLAILKELDLDGEPVPQELSRYIPSLAITQEEIDRRLDLRKECIFTIDPATARDLDDAVSIMKLSDDLYEVGVHISDVSYFLDLGTPLDVKVSERATTIYLVDKAIHMLPIELCLQCSLLPGQDKYALSVIWQMDGEGNIKETKFARTVINSCCKLSYEHAQSIIEGEETELPTLYNDVTPEMVRESILGLHKISKCMTKRRFDGGALRIDQPKVCFRVNEKTVPTEASLYELKDSNRLIEEFMLRANQSVAEYIHSVHPKIALLRRHAPPKAEMIQKLEQALATIGIVMNTSTAGDIHKCIVENSVGDRAKGIVLSVLCSKPMMRADYYCYELDSHHYALNIDMYTHFTSPIRRYVDIVVHRVLCAALGYNDLPKWDTHDVKQFCRTSNKKKNAAKRAGEMSCELFTALYIRENGGMQVEGIVQNVISHALDIIIVPLALNTRVYLDRLPAKLEYHENSFDSSLTIVWNHAPELPITYRLFSTVQVSLKTQETHLSIDTQLIPPVPIPIDSTPTPN
uniref:DIS3-like exonuclease 2 n=1 Tax=Lygus hesperus TaxID=30085 RepID=A0A0A9VVG8_LYGHE